MLVRRIACLMVIGLAALALRAEEEESPACIGFDGMEVHTFKDRTRGLSLEDVNGDGRLDILFLNAMASRLEVLVRKDKPRDKTAYLAELDDVFASRGVILDQQVLDYEVGLFDADSDKPGLMTFGRTLGFRLFELAANGSPESPKDIYVDGADQFVQFESGDLNGDGALDIAAFRPDGATLLWNRKGEEAFTEQTQLDLAGARCMRGAVSDVNADGIPDLLFFMKPPGAPLVVRLGDGEGGFGFERPLEFREGIYSRPLGGKEGAPARLAVVLKRGAGVRLYSYKPEKSAALLQENTVMPARIGVKGAGKSTPGHAVADVNDDGVDDLLVAAPALSRIMLFLGTEGGLTLPALEIDTYADVAAMSFMDNGDLLIVSGSEKMAALHKADDLSAFPRPLDVPGKVMAAVSAGDQVAVASRDEESGAYQLILVDPAKKGSEPTVFEIPDLLNDPGRMQFFDLGASGLCFLIHVPYGKPKMVLIHGDEIKALDVSEFRGLSTSLKPGQVSARVEQGEHVLTVCSGQTARSYKWNADEQRFAVIRQFNPADQAAKLVASCVFGDKESNGRLFLDRGGQNLLWFKDGEKNPRRIHLDADLSNIDAMKALKAGDNLNLVMVGEGGLNLLSDNMKTFELKACSDYVSPTEDAGLTYIRELPMGLPTLTLGFVDVKNGAVEIAQRLNGGMKNLRTIKVYEASSFASDKYRSHEPHALTTGDIDGDGIADMALLVHDRLLIYFGE